MKILITWVQLLLTGKQPDNLGPFEKPDILGPEPLVTGEESDNLGPPCLTGEKPDNLGPATSNW